MTLTLDKAGAWIPSARRSRIACRLKDSSTLVNGAAKISERLLASTKASLAVPIFRRRTRARGAQSSQETWARDVDACLPPAFPSILLQGVWDSGRSSFPVASCCLIPALPVGGDALRCGHLEQQAALLHLSFPGSACYAMSPPLELLARSQFSEALAAKGPGGSTS